MSEQVEYTDLFRRFVVPGDHPASDYFGLLKQLVELRRGLEGSALIGCETEIRRVYDLLEDELRSNQGRPARPVSFGTSGWRGVLGKDLFCRSVAQVTEAIAGLYLELETDAGLAGLLGVQNLAEARRRGCVVGFDNRFGGELLARQVVKVLTGHGFTVHYAGESATGVLSAALLELGAAFSINLTPSHNPLEYGGFKYNAADGGPAASELTSRITEKARLLIGTNQEPGLEGNDALVRDIDSFGLWLDLVRKNSALHGLDLDRILQAAAAADLVVAVDCVHGASRLHVPRLLAGLRPDQVAVLRGNQDFTFGGIAPEPSTANMRPVVALLEERRQALKLGAIIDPDADRIRFTDGRTEISMNQFGAMAYLFLHEEKGRRDLVAKTVASSNLANAVATRLGAEVFEPPVGFKEFKPVIGRALVCFEESDGISVLGHTPEKDAYIGLLLALDMVVTSGLNLGDYLARLEERFGAYYPDRAGVAVHLQGEALLAALAGLEKYQAGGTVSVGGADRRIAEVIAIDGRKMVFEDGSWIMIRPSGTEPKVRFYVEGRSPEDKDRLIRAARLMLAEVGVLEP